MCKSGLIHAVVGDDGDFLCMGSPRMVRFLNLYSGTATEYSLHRLSAAGDPDPLILLAQKYGVEQTFQSFAALVGNDYSKFKGISYVSAVGAIQCYGPEQAALMDGLAATPQQRQHFSTSCLAYTEALIYDPALRKILPMSGADPENVSTAVSSVVGSVVLVETRAENRALGVTAPDGVDTPFLSDVTEMRCENSYAPKYLTPEMVPGATLPDKPKKADLQRFFKTRPGNTYPKNKDGGDARMPVAMECAAQLLETEKKRIADGQRVKIRDPDGKSLISFPLCQEILLDTNNDDSIQLPSDRVPISDKTTIEEQFPCMRQHVMHEHFGAKANTALSYKAYIHGFQRIFNRQQLQMEYWPPTEATDMTAYIKMRVPPSMKNGDNIIYNAWAELAVMRGSEFDIVVSVIKAGCSAGVCKAAAGGKCIHTGAMLWAFILLLRPKDHLIPTECTSRLCAWNKPSTGPCYNFLVPLGEIPFTKDDPRHPEKKSKHPSQMVNPYRSSRYNPIRECCKNDRHNSKRSIARKELFSMIEQRLKLKCLAEQQWYSPIN